MIKPKLAPCGIDCSECASYKATMAQDLDAAGDLVDWYRGMGWIGQDEGAEAVLKLSPLCKGCWNTEKGDCFFKCPCGSRDFRVCVTEKGIDHCGQCDEFPCAYYQQFAAGNDWYKQAMERLMALR